MNVHYSIRPVLLQDVLRLQQMSIATFSDAFAGQNKPEDMAHYLNQAFSIDALTNELNDTDSEFYFAEHASTAVGYIKLNKCCTYAENHQLPAVELERIYVLQSFQKGGVGQILLNFALQWAKNQKAHTLCLGVWQHNAGAIRFYERNGFSRFGSHIFMLGTDPQTDLLMARPL